MLTSSDIRQQFIDYFTSKHGHTFAPSSPVIPHDDDTLLFANAGMNQFKDVFLATGERDYTRAVNTQKCIRAGGKHNDLDDVGKDTYHHTFFEMLGNWSFGDYFKKEAIDWAWDLLVNVWGIEPERLHATYFEGDQSEGLEPDTEAKALWGQYLPLDRIHPGNKKDNFWEMGASGPCGPCSELHYDGTDDLSGASLVNKDDPRVIEIWNLVFIQFNRDAGGSLHPLPAKHIDTGMGFERIVRVLQGKQSNYDTDVFLPLFEAIQKVTGARAYEGGEDSLNDAIDTAYRVIADHIRMATFSIADGGEPGAEKAASVIRSVIRRAARVGRQTFELTEPFMYKLVPTVVENMGDAFPELKRDPGDIADTIKAEEEAFGRTLDRGIALFNEAATRASTSMTGPDEPGPLPAAADQDTSTGETVAYAGVLPGDVAFDLVSTYGFPIDLTQVMAEERGLTIDMAGYERAKKEHEDISRGKVKGDARPSLNDLIQSESFEGTRFLGYDETQSKCDTYCRVFVESDDHRYLPADEAVEGDSVAVMTGATPFYAEAGGQVGDSGKLCNDHGGVIDVKDTVKLGDVIFHLGHVLAGRFENVSQSGDATTSLSFTVDPVRHGKIESNHTSTHVMNHKLRAVLGDHVQQKGSLVDEAKTRFDFSHDKAVSVEDIDRIESMVNHDIGADLPVYDQLVPQDEALKIHSLRAVFGEKYPPVVRVVSIGVPVDDLLANKDNPDWANYSIEFCGGTHLDKTGDAEGFVIVSEEAVSKGVRRLTAQTGSLAHQTQARGEMLRSRMDALGKCSPDELAGKVTELAKQIEADALPLVIRAELRDGLAELQKKVKEIEKQKSKEASGNIVDVARKIADEASGNIIVANVEGADGKTLRDAMDVIRKRHPESAMLLGAATGDRCAFLASVPKDIIGQGLKAGDWVKQAAQVAGGNGGGRPDMAQAGGKDASKLDEALAAGEAYATSTLG